MRRFLTFVAAVCLLVPCLLFAGDRQAIGEQSIPPDMVGDNGDSVPGPHAIQVYLQDYNPGPYSVGGDPRHREFIIGELCFGGGIVSIKYHTIGRRTCEEPPYGCPGDVCDEVCYVDYPRPIIYPRFQVRWDESRHTYIDIFEGYYGVHFQVLKLDLHQPIPTAWLMEGVFKELDGAYEVDFAKPYEVYLIQPHTADLRWPPRHGGRRVVP